MFARRPVALVLAIFALPACSSTTDPPGVTGPSGPPCAEPRFAGGRASTQCGSSSTPRAGVIFLHGVNARVNGVFDVTFDDGRTALEPIRHGPGGRRADAGHRLQRPPPPHQLERPREDPPRREGSADYLDAVEAAVSTAANAGLVVLIDFTRTPIPRESAKTALPSGPSSPRPPSSSKARSADLDARRASAQVLKAFSTFFGPSAKGAALRARFAAAAAHVAARFADNQAVIGIELYNEPLADEDAELNVFHEDEVIAAVQKANPGRLAFFEPNVTRNFFDRTLAQREPWPGSVYAPHVYTLSFTATDEQRKAMTKAKLDPRRGPARPRAGTPRW